MVRTQAHTAMRPLLASEMPEEKDLREISSD